MGRDSRPITRWKNDRQRKKVRPLEGAVAVGAPDHVDLPQLPRQFAHVVALDGQQFAPT
jgi:hypothetical protein